MVVALVGVESKGLEESRVGGRGYKLGMSPLHGEFEQVLLACSKGKGIDMNFKGGGCDNCVQNTRNVSATLCVQKH